MEAVLAAVTTLLVTVKVALVAPDATVSDAGTVAAAVLLLVSVTVAPPAGALPFRVTVAVLFAPPVTVAGFSETEEGVNGLTVSVAVLLTPLYVAVIVTEVAAVTAAVVMLNVAVLAFAAKVIEAGTLAAVELLLVSVTTTPPVGAAPVRVTVPVLEVPPVTAVGLTVTDESAGGLTVSTAVLLTPL
jgi:hypothetical protein